MQNKPKEKHNILIGAVIGGLLGGAALYLLSASRDKHRPVLNKIGEAISEMGEILEEGSLEGSGEAFEKIQKSIPDKDNVVTQVLTWVSTGLTLWKKFNKG